MFRSKRFWSLLLGGLFAIALSSTVARANTTLVPSGLTFNPATINQLKIFVPTDYCIPPSFSCTGELVLGGAAQGIDSLGDVYGLSALGGGSLFTLDPSPNTWGMSPACAGSGTDCIYDNNFELGDKNTALSGAGLDPETLFQAPNGSITLSMDVCLQTGVAFGEVYCSQTGAIVFDLQVDPTMLANLKPGQSVDLTVLGGCVTTGATTCGTSSTTPEPGTLLLVASGLACLGFARRYFLTP